MNYDLANDLHTAMIQADADDEVRVIVFTGAPIHAKVGVPLLMAVVAVWMWRRPEA